MSSYARWKCRIAASLAIGMVLTLKVTAQDKLGMAFQKNDVAAMGFANANTAGGYGFNAMLYNPALLGRASNGLELANVGFYMGSKVVTTAKDVFDSRADLKKAPKTFVDGSKAMANLENGPSSLAETKRAIRAVQKLDKLIGHIDRLNNNMQAEPVGAGVFPGLMFARSFGNNHFGFAAYSNVNLALQIRSGAVVDSLVKLRGQNGLGIDNASKIQSTIDNGLSQGAGALPAAAGYGIVDMIFVTGYARNLNEQWTIGTNVRYVIRRTAVTFVSTDNLNAPITELKNDIKASNSKIGMDVGLTYQMNNKKTTLGLVIQDLVATEKDIKGDGSQLKDQIVEIPVQRDIRFGAAHQFNDHFFVMADVDDIADQTGLYEKAVDRARVGAEYQVRPLSWLTLPIRGGFGQGGFAVGSGLYLGRWVRLDYALSKEHSIETFYQHNLQVRLTWPM